MNLENLTYLLNKEFGEAVLPKDFVKAQVHVKASGDKYIHLRIADRDVYFNENLEIEGSGKNHEFKDKFEIKTVY